VDDTDAADDDDDEMEVDDGEEPSEQCNVRDKLLEGDDDDDRNKSTPFPLVL